MRMLPLKIDISLSKEENIERYIIYLFPKKHKIGIVMTNLCRLLKFNYILMIMIFVYFFFVVILAQISLEVKESWWLGEKPDNLIFELIDSKTQ